MPGCTVRFEYAPCFRDEAALEAALEVLRTRYAAVIVLERLPDSLALLEAVLPRYFTGAKKAAGVGGVRRSGGGGGVGGGGAGGGGRGVGVITARRQNENKGETSEETLELLRRLNALDVMFYEKVIGTWGANHCSVSIIWPSS